MELCSPLLLKAFPRSGGTLFTTMLDAHPEIAMSYEIYENNLISPVKEPLSVDACLASLKKLPQTPTIESIKTLSEPHFITFTFRAIRAGLNIDDIAKTLSIFIRDGGDFLSESNRLSFINRLMKCKAQNLNRNHWGGKTQSNLYTLHKLFPQAVFFIMKRDIRDIYSSMITKGSFKYTPEDAAKLWKENILDFRSFSQLSTSVTLEIDYSMLAVEPVPILQKVCNLASVPYSKEMLCFHKKDMPLYSNSFGHLSSGQIKAGLNSSSIGQWKRILSDDVVRRLCLAAGSLISEFD